MSKGSGREIITLLFFSRPKRDYAILQVGGVLKISKRTHAQRTWFSKMKQTEVEGVHIVVDKKIVSLVF
jgi:hypothetical protein